MRGIKVMRTLCSAAIVATLLGAIHAAADFDPPESESDGPAGPYKPLPDEGPVPPIYDPAEAGEPVSQRRHREAQYRDRIETIRREHFHRMRNPEIRRAGIDQLRTMTDPAAFRPMFDVLEGESDEVRQAVFDHLADQGDEGQAALVWIGIHKVAEQRRPRDARRLHHAVVRRLEQPASQPVLRELDAALRRAEHRVVNEAGRLAGMLNATEAIPLLMLTQITFDEVGDRPDARERDWYYDGTKLLPVRELSWITASDKGDYHIVPATRTSGVVTRERHGRAITYRMDVHNTLVRLSSDAIGKSTRGMGFDMWAWYDWYNETYVPQMNRRAMRERDD